MSINIEELTIKDVREIAAMFGCTLSRNATPTISADHPFPIGSPMLFRTVTMIDTGIVKAVYPTEIVVTDAAWVPDTGRFADAVKKAEFGEVEPFPDGDVIIGCGSIIDAIKITKTPRSQK